MDEIKRVLGLEPGCADWGVLVGVQTFLEWCKGVAVCREAEEVCLRALREQTGELLRERMKGDGFAEEVIAAAVRGYVKGPAEVLMAVYGVGDIVSGANPYGCNQYGEGWAEEHNGNSTRYETTGFSGKQSKMLINKQGGNTVEVATKEKRPGKGAYPDASERGLGKAADDAEQESEKKLAEAKGKDKKRYFKPAKTMKEAKANTASLVGGDAKKVTWGKYMKLEQVNEYNEVIAEMMEKYPLKVQVAQLGSYISSDSEGARCGCKIIGGNVLVRVQINQDHEKGGVHGFHDWKPYDEAKAAKRGFSRYNVGVTENGIDIRAVMIHEWGHALHALARCSDGYGYLMTKANSADVAQDSHNWRHWRDVVFERAKKEGFVNKLSEYSKTNSREFFAECFAARELGEKLPDYVEESLDKIIKRATSKS